MAVVCAGPKAILDVPATLEYLETRGVPVVAIGQAELPGFYARSGGIPAPESVPDVADGGPSWPAHLGLGLGAAIPCACVPGRTRHSPMTSHGTRSTGRSATRKKAGIAGPALTPWLLARIAVLTDGASVRANTALIVNNARVAGEIATLLGTDSA